MNATYVMSTILWIGIRGAARPALFSASTSTGVAAFCAGCEVAPAERGEVKREEREEGRKREE